MPCNGISGEMIELAAENQKIKAVATPQKFNWLMQWNLINVEADSKQSDVYQTNQSTRLHFPFEACAFNKSPSRQIMIQSCLNGLMDFIGLQRHA